MALIVAASTTKQSLVPLPSLAKLDQLTAAGVPPQFSTDAEKLAGTESAKYIEWQQEDSALLTWLLASLSSTYKNKVVHCNQFYETWDISQEPIFPFPLLSVKHLGSQIQEQAITSHQILRICLHQHHHNKNLIRAKMHRSPFPAIDSDLWGPVLHYICFVDAFTKL
ncbi:hypothetical protein PIB30_062804 [Stylosanthes scabra]|uniref:Uncharacterized protein n=1 Tax=Stylosanthes scabra TaxID=79078 RepID=A0ABU6XJ68_9FABA|nr:hypothetical protein [Stylosanthes scabra]